VGLKDYHPVLFLLSSLSIMSGKHDMKGLQKTAILGSVHILGKY